MKIKVKDPIIKRVLKKIVGRSEVGLKKYGVSLKDDPTDLDGWLNHLQEELMDAVNYIERARLELKPENAHKAETVWWFESEVQKRVEDAALRDHTGIGITTPYNEE